MSTKNESGTTLIEVIATLVLSSIIIGLIWTTVMISMKYNIAETKKTDLQKEGNYIVSKLQQIHRNNDCYIFSINPDEISSKSCADQEYFNEIISNKYSYAFELVETEDDEKNIKNITELEISVNSTKENLEIMTLTIIDTQKGKLKISFPVLITRYKIK